MIVQNIIVSFCIFSLLKHDRIFVKNLEHDTYGGNEILDPSIYREPVPDLGPEIYISFHET